MMTLIKKINLFLVFGAITSVTLGFVLNTKKSTIQSGNVEGIEIGNMAPEIRLRNPNDSLIPLSSLKGKIVLVDFWASWCGPCRMENPNVVASYNKYKAGKFKNAKGFTIYNVSLDMNKESWKKAIVKDGLVWPYHVSDLKHWASEAARAYGVGSIPSNFLLDAKGVIIAKNLRGASLDQALENLIVSGKGKKTAKN